MCSSMQPSICLPKHNTPTVSVCNAKRMHLDHHQYSFASLWYLWSGISPDHPLPYLPRMTKHHLACLYGQLENLEFICLRCTWQGIEVCYWRAPGSEHGVKSDAGLLVPVSGSLCAPAAPVFWYKNESMPAFLSNRYPWRSRAVSIPRI